MLNTKPAFQKNRSLFFYRALRPTPSWITSAYRLGRNILCAAALSACAASAWSQDCTGLVGFGCAPLVSVNPDFVTPAAPELPKPNAPLTEQIQTAGAQVVKWIKTPLAWAMRPLSKGWSALMQEKTLPHGDETAPQPLAYQLPEQPVPVWEKKQAALPPPQAALNAPTQQPDTGVQVRMGLGQSESVTAPNIAGLSRSNLDLQQQLRRLQIERGKLEETTQIKMGLELRF